MAHCCTSIISLLVTTDSSLRSPEALRVVVGYLHVALRSWNAWGSYASVTLREFQALFLLHINGDERGEGRDNTGEDAVHSLAAFKKGIENIMAVLGTSVEFALLFVRSYVELYTKACNTSPSSSSSSLGTASFFSPVDPTKKLISSLTAEFKASNQSSLPIVDYLKQLKASRNSATLDKLIASLDEVLFAK